MVADILENFGATLKGVAVVDDHEIGVVWLTYLE
jgi:hypothetical protein